MIARDLGLGGIVDGGLDRVRQLFANLRRQVDMDFTIGAGAYDATAGLRGGSGRGDACFGGFMASLGSRCRCGGGRFGVGLWPLRPATPAWQALPVPPVPRALRAVRQAG